MKKITLFLSLLIFSFSVSFAQKTMSGPKNPKPADPDDAPMILIGGYDDDEEEEPKKQPAKQTQKPTAKPQNTAKPKEQVKPTSETKTGEAAKTQPTEKKLETLKKSDDLKTIPAKTQEQPKKTEANTILLDFKINLPKNCKAQISADKKTADISDCVINGQLGQFEAKMPVKTLIDSYKNKCLKNSSEILYKRWLNNEVLEGYINICDNKKDIDVIMEANSNAKNLSYQFYGKLDGKFDKDKKVAVFLIFNSLTENTEKEK